MKYRRIDSNGFLTVLFMEMTIWKRELLSFQYYSIRIFIFIFKDLVLALTSVYICIYLCRLPNLHLLCKNKKIRVDLAESVVLSELSIRSTLHLLQNVA